MTGERMRHEAPSNWVALMFAISEGPLAGYQAALNALRPDGEDFTTAVTRHRMTVNGLAVRR